MLIMPEMDQDPYGEGHTTDDKTCPRDTEPILRELSSLTYLWTCPCWPGCLSVNCPQPLVVCIWPPTLHPPSKRKRAEPTSSQKPVWAHATRPGGLGTHIHGVTNTIAELN